MSDSESSSSMEDLSSWIRASSWCRMTFLSSLLRSRAYLPRSPGQSARMRVRHYVNHMNHMNCVPHEPQRADAAATSGRGQPQHVHRVQTELLQLRIHRHKWRRLEMPTRPAARSIYGCAHGLKLLLIDERERPTRWALSSGCIPRQYPTTMCHMRTTNGLPSGADEPAC